MDPQLTHACEARINLLGPSNVLPAAKVRRATVAESATVRPPSKMVELVPHKLQQQGVVTKRPASKTIGRVLQMDQKPTAKKSIADDPRVAQAIQNYETGLRAMQEHKFDKAKAHLQKVIGGPSKELADRANVHLNTCNQHLERVTTQFKTPEEHFDYAVSLMNVGDYVSAREHIDKILKQTPRADYVLYGLAALDCLTGHVEDSLKHLAEAIGQNPAVRF